MPRGGGIRDLAAYEPASLAGKYQWHVMRHSSMTETNIKNNGRLWYPFIYKTYGNNIQALWDIMVPGVMVDNSGTLFYTMEWRFAEPNDPQWALGKLTPKNNTLEVVDKRYLYLVEHMRLTNNSDSIGSIKHDQDPKNDVYGDGTFHKTIIHNMFTPTIAQEVMSSGTAASFFITLWFPPCRWANVMTSPYKDESLVTFKVRKNDLVLESVSRIKPDQFTGSSSNQGGGKTNRLPQRAASWSRYLQPEWGNFKTCYDGSNLYLFGLRNSTGALDLSNSMHMTHYYAKISPSSWSETTQQLKTYNETIEDICLASRFINFNNACYFLCCVSTHHAGLMLNRLDKTTGTAILKLQNYYEGSFCPTNAACCGRTQRDFCLLKNGDQLVACFLGFKFYETNCDLQANYGWNDSYTNWGYNSKPVCLLYSVPLSDNASAQANIELGTNLNTHAQNIIYAPNVTRNNIVTHTDKNGSSLNRLTLNTQMFVPYTSASGKTYIIYAYCYPGKAKQLRLGYAPYYFDSTGHVRLLPKTEFNSFGHFEDCYRIYHMDLKNGHLWIAFVGYNKGYPSFYFFHILAKDLVQE